MQVRKFEAKSIRDAIELVKFHLGPDAIILSAKENVKGFGLVGESSVEVTAAVSEQKLMRKKMAEKKLDSKSKERFARATATNQKQFISKVFHESELSAATIENEYPTAVRAAPPPEPPLHKQNGITSVRYAEIDSNTTDDFTGVSQAKPKVAIPIEASINTGSSRAQQTALPSQSAAGGEKVALLQQEITYLKSLLDNFQRMPQGFVSMHPGAQDGLPYELSFVYKKLADAGISQENIVEILKKANQLLPAEQKKEKGFR